MKIAVQNSDLFTDFRQAVSVPEKELHLIRERLSEEPGNGSNFESPLAQTQHVIGNALFALQIIDDENCRSVLENIDRYIDRLAPIEGELRQDLRPLQPLRQIRESLSRTLTGYSL